MVFFVFGLYRPYVIPARNLITPYIALRSFTPLPLGFPSIRTIPRSLPSIRTCFLEGPHTGKTMWFRSYISALKDPKHMIEPRIFVRNRTLWSWTLSLLLTTYIFCSSISCFRRRHNMTWPLVNCRTMYQAQHTMLPPNSNTVKK